VDTRRLDPAFAGREFERQLLRDLPADVDPCGENGEFHSCVYEGPMFSHPLQVTPGELVHRAPFVFADLYVGRGLSASPSQA
jgi:diphthamide synthase (EF-2-diphthine--ammonia ligase)